VGFCRMAKASGNGFGHDFKRFFFRGLATILPTLLTIVVLVQCFEFIQDNISVHITRGIIYAAIHTFDDYPKISESDEIEYRKVHNLAVLSNTDENRKDIRQWKLTEQWTRGPQSLIGFVFAVILVYILGRLLASFVGRKLWKLFEQMVQQVPGFKQVYPYVKQVIDFLFADKKISFSRVVAVPYPRKGIWSVGLVTGAGFRSVAETNKEEYLTVFIPSSPTPVTGYVIYVKKEDVIDLPITLEEALRFTVSGGVIVPEHQALPRQQQEMKSGPTIKISPGPKSDSKDT